MSRACQHDPICCFNEQGIGWPFFGWIQKSLTIYGYILSFFFNLLDFFFRVLTYDFRS